MHAAGGAAAAEQAVIDSQDDVLEGCKGPQAAVALKRSGLTGQSLLDVFSCIYASKENTLRQALSPYKVMGSWLRCLGGQVDR